MQYNELNDYDCFLINQITNRVEFQFPTKMTQNDYEKLGKSILNHRVFIEGIPIDFNKRVARMINWLTKIKNYDVPAEDDFVEWFKRKRSVRPEIQINGSLEQIESILVRLPQSVEVTEYDLIEYCKEYTKYCDNIDKELEPAVAIVGERGKVKREQQGGNNVDPLERQEQTDIFKRAIIELCNQNRGKAKNIRFNLSQIINLALSTKGIKSYKTLDRYIKESNLGTTHIQYSRQLVRQYCTNNSLNINYFN